MAGDEPGAARTSLPNKTASVLLDTLEVLCGSPVLTSRTAPPAIASSARTSERQRNTRLLAACSAGRATAESTGWSRGGRAAIRSTTSPIERSRRTAISAGAFPRRASPATVNSSSTSEVSGLGSSIADQFVPQVVSHRTPFDDRGSASACVRAMVSRTSTASRRASASSVCAMGTCVPERNTRLVISSAWTRRATSPTKRSGSRSRRVDPAGPCQDARLRRDRGCPCVHSQTSRRGPHPWPR